MPIPPNTPPESPPPAPPPEQAPGGPQENPIPSPGIPPQTPSAGHPARSDRGAGSVARRAVDHFFQLLPVQKATQVIDEQPGHDGVTLGVRSADMR